MFSVKRDRAHCWKSAVFPLLILFTLLFSIMPYLAVEFNPPDNGIVPTRIYANQNANETLVFHMHWDGVNVHDGHDWMNTSGTYDPASEDYDNDGIRGATLLKTPASSNFLNFSTVPSTNAPVHIKGNVTLKFWANSSSTTPSTIGLTVSLYDSSNLMPQLDAPSLINSTTYSNDYTTGWALQTVTIPFVNHTIPAGNSLILHLLRDNVGPATLALRMFYDFTTFDSIMIVPTVSHFNISNSGSSGFDYIPRTEFGNQETIYAFANVTDALGAYDVNSATIIVNYTSNASTVVSRSMSVDSSGPVSMSVWKLYRTALGPLNVGNFTIDVIVLDNSGNYHRAIWNIGVIAIDHFDVSSSTTKVKAGEPFTLTIEAKDSSDIRLKNWSGVVQIDAIDQGTGSPIPGISNSSLFISSANHGIVNISENFSLAPKDITIRVTNGSTEGNSQVISVLPGPIWSLTVDPTSVTVPAGAIIDLKVNATDRFGNINTSWQPYWFLEHPANVTLIPNGMKVQLIAILAGFTNLTCKDNTSGKNFTVGISVTTSGLVSIAVVPYSGVMWEGRSMSVTATGYDSFGNPFSIIGAVWSTEGFAMATVVGSGSSGVLFAGMAPETGLIKVTLGVISGNASVLVISPPEGPTLGTFSNQVGYEDTSWSVDLSVYWNDPNVTSALTWFVTGVNDSLLIIGHDIASSSIINFIPQPDANGVDIVTFWVRDPTGYTNSKEITVTVLPINDAPSFINNPPKELYVKFDLPYSFDYSYYVQDVDNPKDQLVLSADPSAGITPSGLSLTYDFPDEDSGAPYFRIITVSISDGSLYDSFTLKVWATSDTPPDLVAPLPDVTILEGDMNVFVFDLDNYFKDIDGDMLFYSEGFENVKVEINATSHEVFISSPSEWSGQTTAVFVAHDPTGAIRIDTIVITVIAVNDPPVISPIPKVFVHYLVDFSLDLGLYVSDPDNDIGSLTIYTDDASNASYSNLPTPSLKLNYPANPSGGAYAGPYDMVVNLHVIDPGGLFTDASFTVEISDNYPPVFTRSPPDIISFMEDTYLDRPHSIDISILFTDPDPADVLSFNFTGNKNVSIVIGSDGWLNFSAAPDWYGTEYITFKATDPHGAWLSFKVRVDVIPVNDPPVLSQIPDVDHYGGRQWSMDISQYVTDVDNPLSSIEIFIDQPSFVRAVGTTLYFEFPADIDSALVILYLSDGQANSNMITFNVNIKQSINEIIPWQVIAIILVAGIVCYLIALRILPHKLQELFIIHNDGRLIIHSGRAKGEETDEDVVSAMFTAVQDFIKDSFKEGGESLKKMEMGDRKIVIEKGKWIYAAMIYTGWPHKSVFKNLSRFIADIEGSYGNNIEHWDGTLKSLPGMDAASKEMLEKKYRVGDIEEIRSEEDTPKNN